VLLLAAEVGIFAVGCNSEPLGPISSNPQAVGGNITFQSLAAGADMACGVATSGAAFCWGSGGGYQLPGAVGVTDTPLPLNVGGPVAFSSVSVGASHICGVTSAGTATCWGDGQAGELGTGAATYLAAAGTAVSGGLSFAMLSAGSGRTCGVTVGGAAYCWGSDGHWSLGTGAPRDTAVFVPVAVSGGLSFTFVATATEGGHVCGLARGGIPYCWGNNDHGQLGIASAADSAIVPVPVVGGQIMTTLSLGALHTCGLTPIGAAYCWGDNSVGQLGTGSSASYERAPAAVAGGLRFVSISGGNFHTCGVTTGGRAFCWGANNYGQLGNGFGDTSFVPVPVFIPGIGGLTTVAGGAAHTCALTTAGAAYCWGTLFPCAEKRGPWSLVQFCAYDDKQSTRAIERPSVVQQ